ncbi:hypothetical protein NEOC95_000884 [Neochlamydia sp. AcF95]|nr:hypothetical protein [Neochlamydia sp. AcF95]
MKIKFLASYFSYSYPLKKNLAYLFKSLASCFSP